jgi:hypothetical protein
MLRSRDRMRTTHSRAVLWAANHSAAWQLSNYECSICPRPLALSMQPPTIARRVPVYYSFIRLVTAPLIYPFQWSASCNFLTNYSFELIFLCQITSTMRCGTAIRFLSQHSTATSPPSTTGHSGNSQQGFLKLLSLCMCPGGRPRPKYWIWPEIFVQDFDLESHNLFSFLNPNFQKINSASYNYTVSQKNTAIRDRKQVETCWLDFVTRLR